MEHLCVGSYARILTSCAIPAENNFDPFCEKLFLSLCDEDATAFFYVSADGNDVTYSSSNFNKIHLSKQNLPKEVMQMALTKDAPSIQRYFVKKIIPALDEGRKKNAVLALKNIILKDTTIADSTQLGRVHNLTKEELKTKTDFVLSEFLSDIFIFAVAHTENAIEPDFTKSIKKDFYSIYNPMVDTIQLYEISAPRAVATIPISSKGKFDKVFSPVSSERLSISSSHDLQVFCLKFDDFDFNYHELWGYLRNNIGYYVYSRAQIKKYMDDDELASLAYDAIGQIKKTVNAGKALTGNELGELLLYVFLEQVLRAPKLMSKVEIGTFGGVSTSESSGIHLLTADAPAPFSQIVLGTSFIDGELHTAIDVAFSNAKKLKNRKTDERRFVESNIFAQSFTKEISDQLEAIILPSGRTTKNPTTAFGMFLGYSVSNVAKNGKDVYTYQSDILAQAKADIQNNVSYIESKISENGLDGYSLYIYLLPFADADEDKKDIMDKLLQNGGGVI